MNEASPLVRPDPADPQGLNEPSRPAAPPLPAAAEGQPAAPFRPVPLDAFLASPGDHLRRGPIAIILVEDMVEVAATLSHHIERPESDLHDRLHLHAERIGDRPLGNLPHDSVLYASLRAVDRHLGITTEPRLGSTDANLPLAQGIPALAIGAGGTGGGLHSTAEWYDPTGREIALRRILLLLLDAGASLPLPESTL